MQFHEKTQEKVSLIFEPGCEINVEQWEAIYGSYIDFDSNLVDAELGQITSVTFKPVPGYDGLMLWVEYGPLRPDVFGGYLHTDGEWATFPQDCVS